MVSDEQIVKEFTSIFKHAIFIAVLECSCFCRMPNACSSRSIWHPTHCNLSRNRVEIGELSNNEGCITDASKPSLTNQRKSKDPGGKATSPWITKRLDKVWQSEIQAHFVLEQSSVESEHCPGGGVVNLGQGSGNGLAMGSPFNMARTKCPDLVNSQSSQPPSPLAPGKRAEQASSLSLTAQLAWEMLSSSKKSILRFHYFLQHHCPGANMKP